MISPVDYDDFFAALRDGTLQGLVSTLHAALSSYINPYIGVESLTSPAAAANAFVIDIGATPRADLRLGADGFMRLSARTLAYFAATGSAG